MTLEELVFDLTKICEDDVGAYEIILKLKNNYYTVDHPFKYEIKNIKDVSKSSITKSKNF